MNKSEFNGAQVREQMLILVEEWLQNGGKKNLMLDDIFGDTGNSENRPILTAWFSGFLRGYRLWNEWLEAFCARQPKRKARVLLLSAISVVWNSREEQRPIQVNEWVRAAQKFLSKPESGLVNAILRRVLKDGAGLLAKWQADPACWGIAWSHPDWLVQRWIRVWGEETTRHLLESNQQVPPVYLRWTSTDQAPAELQATDWTDFYVVPESAETWKSWVKEGKAYIQDPATRIAVEMLNPAPQDNLIEWCAAPGGKSLLLAALRSKRAPDDLGEMKTGTHLAVDLPGYKLQLLQSNLARYPVTTPIQTWGADALEIDPKKLSEAEYPFEWDCLFLDTPCSNTGVMARKPEVRYRLTPADFNELAKLQTDLLHRASTLVKPGGRLLYSTCSIDPEENELRIEEFLRNHPGWTLQEGKTWLPHTSGHDGGGAFLLNFAK